MSAGAEKKERGKIMNYNEACEGIIRKLEAAGYVAINIDYDSQKRGPGRYSVSAKNQGRVRVIIAYTGSYQGLYEETIEYLK